MTRIGVIELDIVGTIGERIVGGDGVLLRDIEERLAANPDAREIKLRIDSPGGNLRESKSIYNRIRSHGARVTARVTGVCESGASIVLLAADWREAVPAARFHLHFSEYEIAGASSRERWTANRHLATGAALQASNRELAAFYARHLGRSKVNIEVRLANGWDLDATAALEVGLIHKILGGSAL